jgi:hypothetical protein
MQKGKCKSVSQVDLLSDNEERMSEIYRTYLVISGQPLDFVINVIALSLGAHNDPILPRVLDVTRNTRLNKEECNFPACPRSRKIQQEGGGG